MTIKEMSQAMNQTREVERLSPELEFLRDAGRYVATMEPNENGFYVTHTAYAALQQELAELRERLAKAEGLIMAWRDNAEAWGGNGTPYSDGTAFTYEDCADELTNALRSQEPKP